MGDLVRVAKNLGSSMSHFTNDCDAIVMYSYADNYGGGNTESYGIYIKGKGQTAWYHEHQLTLIEPNRCDLLRIWKDEAEGEANQKSNLEWIFTNYNKEDERVNGATIAKLAECLGVTNLWGSNGEGYVYYTNARKVLSEAKPFLINHDLDGWNKYCDNFKNKGSKE